MANNVVIDFDTETYPFAPGMMAPKLVCVSISGENLPAKVYAADAGATLLEGYLAKPDHTLCGHNIAYDLAVLAAYRPSTMPAILNAYDRGNVFDTMIRCLLLALAKGFWEFDPRIRAPGSIASLKNMAMAYLGIEVAKEDTWRLRYHELDGIPLAEWPAEAIEYSKRDAEITTQLRLAVTQPHCEELISQRDEINQTRAAFAFHLASCWGMRTDLVTVDALDRKLTAAMDEELAALQSCPECSGRNKESANPECPVCQGEGGWLVRANGKGNLAAQRKAVSEAYAVTGDNPPETDGGKEGKNPQISVSELTLLSTDSEPLQALARYNKEKKESTTFLRVVKSGTKHPISPRVNILVRNGRCSYQNPNLQQLPRRAGVRECFIPRPGRAFVAVDYSVAEMRAMSQILLNMFGRSCMAEVFIQGKDPHITVASGILGWTYEAVVADMKANPGGKGKHARETGKRANYGFMGGMGIDRFVLTCRKEAFPMDRGRAKELRDLWLQTYPEMAMYFRKVSDSTELGGGKFTLVQPISGRIRADVGYTDGCNSPFSGLVGDVAKRALYLVSRECYAKPQSPLYGSRVVCFVHDELLCEVPIPKVHEASARICDRMKAAAQTYAPDIPWIVDATAMDRWSKGAKATWIDGKLTVTRVELPWQS